MQRKPIKTKINDVINYWMVRIDECVLSVDWSEADSHCWRCGCEKNLERCHIIPDSLGGLDSPNNLVLLCKRCHAENPNVSDPEIMWDWIKAYKVPYYEEFWKIRGMQEYKFIYKKSIVQELLDLGFTKKEIEYEAKEIYEELLNETSYHFGQPYLNSVTMAGLLRMMIKKLAYKHGKQLTSSETKPNKPWWIIV